MSGKLISAVAPLVVLVLSACDHPPAPTELAPRAPSRAVVLNDHVESIVFGFTGCTGDFLVGTGKIHTVIGVTYDAAGGYHLTVKEQFSNVKVTGDPSGASYVGSQELTENIYIATPSEQTVQQTVKIIGQGKTPNALVHFSFHITVNPNGDITSFVDNFSLDCH